MVLEDLKSAVEEILHDTVEGRVSDKIEDVLSEVISDYERFENMPNDSEYRTKYEELKEKYIKRFITGSDGEYIEPTAEHKEETEEITTEDLFKEDE